MGELGLGGEEGALGIEYVEKIDQAAAVTVMGQFDSASMGLFGLGQFPEAHLCLSVGHQRILELLERGEYGLLVGLNSVFL